MLIDTLIGHCKKLGFYQIEDEFRLDFADNKHDYTCHVYRSDVCFVGQGHGPLSFPVTALMLK